MRIEVFYADATDGIRMVTVRLTPMLSSQKVQVLSITRALALKAISGMASGTRVLKQGVYHPLGMPALPTSGSKADTQYLKSQVNVNDRPLHGCFCNLRSFLLGSL